MKPRYAIVAVACAALASAPAGASSPVARSAGAHTPWLGLYDCFNAGGYYGLTYSHSIRLKSHGVYQHAYDRHNGQLKKPTKGKWRWNGSKKRIVFKTGTMKGFYGRWHARSSAHPKGWFAEELKNGQGSAPACYPTKFK
jgi:hypothetical protein